ncbi:pseudouridine synthase [Inhella gelatinilytica]|uniref:Pseudouridine synthase n=1 Tax=Inhella gelatinilytica TaxID=2795030 RepID=A0A931NER3_9BURK|nr:pseudouridine synthase [Inhella gelatinilytica]MBH9553490.1 pseudouridine synthase [Inhella gelatinilytica]
MSEDVHTPDATPADESAPVKPKKRSPRVKKAEEVVTTESAPAEAVEASESAAPSPAPAKKRAPARKRKVEAAEAVVSDAVASDVLPAASAPPVEMAPESEDGPTLGAANDANQDGDLAVAAAEGPSYVLEAAQVEAALNERLTALLAEGEAPAEDEPSVAQEPEKRVLAPEADAPKLQKVLAQSGVGSRRDIEAWIAEGKIEVNGQPAHIGQRVSWGDKVSVNGKPVRIRIAPGLPRILAYHKPVGEIVTFNDPEGRPTVFRTLPKLPMGKWLSVGRLDINTEGLLLFTNSGDLANQLMHPRFGVEREYAVRVLGQLEDEARARLLAGVEVDGQTAAFKSVEAAGGEGANRWYRVVITEGRNREVRKLFDAIGLTVSRLIRVRYGSVVLPLGLKRGVWVELGGNDVKAIRRLAHPHGDRGERMDRGERPERGERTDRSDRSEDTRGPRGRGREGQEPRDGRGPREGREQRPRDEAQRLDRSRPAEPRRRPDEDDDYMPRDINPLEQTFDRRHAKQKRGFPMGFGHGGSAPDDQGPRGGRGGGREPDPMQTSVGYIGADSFHRRQGGGGGGGAGGGKGGRRRR